MPDVVTASERALIDAAVAARRVRVIPRGVSGFAQATWCADRNALVERSDDGGSSQHWREQSKRFWRRRAEAALRPAAGQSSRDRFGRPIDPEVAERRQRVAALAKQGAARSEIAEALGANVKAVQRDLRWLRERGLVPWSEQRINPPRKKRSFG